MRESSFTCLRRGMCNISALGWSVCDGLRTCSLAPSQTTDVSVRKVPAPLRAVRPARRCDDTRALRAQPRALRRAVVNAAIALAVVIAMTTPSPLAAQESSVLERHNLTGDWNGVRPALSAHGFQPYLTYTGTLWSNLAGGRETGTQANGYLDFGADVDLAKLGAWDGLGFHTDFHWWQG